MVNHNISFYLNDKLINTNENPALLTLDFLREKNGLKGTKAACREGDCGSCVVLWGKYIQDRIEYIAVCSCLLPIADLHGTHIVSIEGLNQSVLTPIQQTLVDFGAIQCGFCTPGFVISLTSYFLNAKNFNRNEALTFIEGNICRCTGYNSIIKAIDSLNNSFREKLMNSEKSNRIEDLISLNILPSYFDQIEDNLKSISPQKDDDSGTQLKLAGGTDLYVQKEEELLDEKINFLFRSKHLNFITEKPDHVSIGAGVSTETFSNSQQIINIIPSIKQFIKLVSSLPIRHRATIGGNIVNASPIADITIILLALKAQLKINGPNTYRIINLDNFFLDYKKFDLQKDEIISEIIIPKYFSIYRFNFEKVSKRRFLDIASVNTALAMKIDDQTIKDIIISAGGVAPIPLYLKNTSEFLFNKKLTPTLIKEALSIIDSDISPISDIRGSAEYKRNLLKRLVLTHFITLVPEINFSELV